MKLWKVWHPSLLSFLPCALWLRGGSAVFGPIYELNWSVWKLLLLLYRNTWNHITFQKHMIINYLQFLRLFVSNRITLKTEHLSINLSVIKNTYICSAIKAKFFSSRFSCWIMGDFCLSKFAKCSGLLHTTTIISFIYN